MLKALEAVLPNPLLRSVLMRNVSRLNPGVTQRVTAVKNNDDAADI